MSWNSALALGLFLVVLSHVSLSMSSFPNLGVSEAQIIRVGSNAVLDLEDTERLTKRNNNNGLETYQTSVPEPQQDATYTEDSNPPITNSPLDFSLNYHGTSASITRTKVTFVSGNLSVPALPATIRRPYGQILYHGIGLSNQNLSLSALLQYPTTPDGDYTGAAVWTYSAYVTTQSANYFQTFLFPVVQGDSIYAEIRSNGAVHSVIGQVNGRQVFNFTVVLTTNLTAVAVSTQVVLVGACSDLPSNNVQYFENIKIKNNDVALTTYNWNINDNVPKVCNSTVVCCSNDCLAYWNNPSTSLTCAQVRSTYGIVPTSSVTRPRRTTKAPTSAAPTTEPVTSAGPTTKAPTTRKPTTQKPTTRTPTTKAPTTQRVTTQKVTTQKPTTRTPTTKVPTTRRATTPKATTQKPTTAEPTPSTTA